MESLLLGDKPTFDAQSFLGNVLTTLVSEFLGICPDPLLGDESNYSILPLFESEWTNHWLFVITVKAILVSHGIVFLGVLMLSVV